MYRDDPLDDELELRELIGDEPVDRLHEAAGDLAEDPVAVALDAMRVLQGWVTDVAVGAWFHQPQKRLDGRSPIDALAAGANEDVLDAARAFSAAQG